jgi:hypothetical protein
VPYSLILDFLVAILLVVTIAFAFILNKRLGKLRGDRKAFEKLAETFGDSTSRAEEGISALHQTTNVLQERLDKAQALKDDLTFMIERGDRTADKLEKLVRATRDTAALDSQAGIFKDTHLKNQSNQVLASEENPSTVTQEKLQPLIDSENNGEEKSEAEQELLKAIRSSS